jgi:hypothetical protein
VADASRIKECDSLIRQVKGVISSQIVKGKDGEISEIHILADASRSPKQVVRDIESAVLVQLGVEIDHKKISVAQLQGRDEGPAPNFRPRVEGVEFVSRGGKAEARVSIDFGDEPYKGTAQGANVIRNHLRLAAAATLEAVEGYLGGTARFMLEDVQKATFSGRDIVLVCVSLLTPVREEIFLGSALVTGDDREAAVKGTLDAINRRLFLLKKE